ncbi:hypothetical protein [Glaciecola petra]|uniref:IPT/TIG domain-containing protein n=1 Tax=Glaciecola petra TaxID=3075602 RepID=A0ABU2ZV63_9ALTE|nr:hypothetical protein [Aestuariibacter sp. P117]MDT0595928.1 hypothetical protein [Aestuariibacter sp. P117]
MMINTKTTNSLFKSALLCTVAATLLVACGGGNSDTAAPAIPAAPAEPTGEASPPSVATDQTQIGKSVMSADFDEATFLQDQDKDGLNDTIDNDPFTPLRKVSGEGVLSLAMVASDINGSLQNNVVITGNTVTGRLDNSHKYSPPFYLMWHGQAGIQAQEIAVDEHGGFVTSLNEALPTGVSVAAQGIESEALIVQAYTAHSPILFKHQTPIYTGEQAVLEGVHLEAISELFLGDVALNFSVENKQIVTHLPQVTSSNVLSWKTDTTTSSIVLPLMREIELFATNSLEVPSEWSALSEQGKIVLSAPHTGVMAPVTISLPVNNKPSYLRFYHANNRSVEAVVWPHSQRIELGVQSTLESLMVKRLSDSLPLDQQSSIKNLIDYSFSLDAGEDSLARISELHEYAYSLESENKLIQEVDKMLAVLSAQSDAIQSRSFNSFVVNNQSSSSLFDYLDDTFAAVFAGDVMYEPISKVVGFKTEFGANSYSGMKISFYRDAFTCLGLESVNKPAGIWPSDLCARNEGVYFASLQVTNALTNKVLKSHAKEFLDTGMIGASGWGLLSLDQIAYVASDSGAPLCHMQVCKLEFLTGGLGVGTNVTLTKAQQKAQNIVLGRTMLERVVLPIVGSLLGQANVDGATGQCLAKFIATSAPTSLVSYGTMVAEFKKKIDAANNPVEIENIVKETIAKYAYDIAGSMLVTNKLPDCLPKALSDNFFASLKEKVKDFAEKAAIPIRVASIATNAFQGFQAVYTPEKFTFEVAPRASITRISTSNSGIDDDIPELFSTVDSNKLFIRGTKFVYLQSDGENYWPKLRLTDRFGNKQTLQLNESHKIDISDLSWVDIGIPISDLAPLMKKLRGEIINVSIIMDDNDYSDFSSEGLPLPGRDIRWVGQPKIFKATPQNARLGRLITIRGENLQSFAARYDLKLKLIQVNDASKTGEIFKVESATDSKIKFRLPRALPLNFYKLRLETSDPNVQLEVPDDIKIGNATGALNVIPNDASLVELYDSGAKIDDAIIIYIANADGDLISQSNDLLRLELLENNPLPAVSMWWNKDNLSAQNGGTTVPGQVLITCDSGGTDQICTYRIKGEVLVGTNFKTINFRGKLETGEDRVHVIPQ